MFVLPYTQTERFDQMSEHQHTAAASLASLEALCERIEAEAPHLRILDVFESPHPFFRVKDTVHGIVVGFSSEDDYVTYMQIVSRTGVNHHA